LESSRRESRVLDATSGKNHDEVLPVGAAGGSSPRFKSKFCWNNSSNEIN